MRRSKKNLLNRRGKWRPARKYQAANFIWPFYNNRLSIHIVRSRINGFVQSSHSQDYKVYTIFIKKYTAMNNIHDFYMAASIAKHHTRSPITPYDYTVEFAQQQHTINIIPSATVLLVQQLLSPKRIVCSSSLLPITLCAHCQLFSTLENPPVIKIHTHKDNSQIF